MRVIAGISLVALVALPLSSAAQDEPAPPPAQEQATPTAAQADIAPMSAQDERRPQSPGQGGLEAILHRDTMFNGPFLSVRGPQPNLNPGWDPRSIRVRSGEWQICTGRNYTGRCNEVTRDQPVLPPHQRPILSMRPTGGWGTGVGESLRGAQSEFFPAPMRNGQRIDCGAGSNCARSPANEFCRRMGWLMSRSQAVETVGGRRFVADVLCARTLT